VGLSSSTIDQLVEVEVLRIGASKPARVLVRFVADEFQGRQDWVPPARLKVLWSRVDEFIAREAQWAAIIDASWIRDTADDYAASTVFDALIDKSLATIGYNSCAGVTTIHDVDGLTGFLELEPYNRPCWDLPRRWCGVEAATRRDELLELRKEVARLGDLMQQAIAGLRAAGQTREADRLERALGVPVEDLRA
jgi:hypothetical protein